MNEAIHRFIERIARRALTLAAASATVPRRGATTWRPPQVVRVPSVAANEPMSPRAG